MRKLTETEFIRKVTSEYYYNSNNLGHIKYTILLC